jgi:hypothetical protein
MALTTALAEMVLGPRNNSKQMVFGIPAGGAESPGLLCLESVDAAGTTFSKLYLWADSTGALRYHTSIPTDEDSDGSALATSSSTSQANRYLSNLLTTSINTSLISDTNNTDSLGSSSVYWKGTYTKILYLDSAAYLTGTAGVMTSTGDFVHGANGTGADFTFYGDTSDVYMWWDRNANTNGALIFTGATASPSLQFTNTNVTYTAIMASDILTIDATDHSSAKITIGNDATTNGIDFTYFMHTTGSAITIDAGADTLRFDDMTLSIRTGSTDTLDITSGANNVYFDAGTANDTLNIGNTTAMDVLFHGNDAGRDARWDASADTLGLLDNAILGFGNTAAAPDITIKWDATDLLIEGAAANTAIKIGATNNQDVYIYAATATSYVHFNTDDAAGNCVFTNYDLAFANGTTTYTFAHSTNSLLMSATDAATAKLVLGTTGTNGLDVTFQAAGAGKTVAFDAGAATMTFTDVSGVFLKNSANFNGLAIPYGATASASGAATAGSVYYEVDAHKLWVCEGGTTWVYFQNAG